MDRVPEHCGAPMERLTWVGVVPLVTRRPRRWDFLVVRNPMPLDVAVCRSCGLGQLHLDREDARLGASLG